MRFISLLLSLTLLASCRTSAPVAPAEVLPPPPFPTHENLHAVLWTQHSVEYAATTRSLYRLARDLVDNALIDSAWTADPVQRSEGNYRQLPPAIVMDIDETVLDNSAYQARLVEDNRLFDPESWNAWVEEAAADIVPGADEFIQYAQRRGVLVFFITNRTAEGEQATLTNFQLKNLSPIHPDKDLMLFRGELPEWDSSDKESRRAHVRAEHRVILYVGDNLGDFVSGERASIAERAALVKRYQSLWGQRWLMLPNPQYGSWEGALFDFDYSLTPDSVRAAKYRQLRTLR